MNIKILDILEDALCKLTETVNAVADLQYDIGQVFLYSAH